MNLAQRCYDWLFSWTEGLQSLLLLLIRVVWGTLFFFAGWGKLNSLPETAAAFQQLGIAEHDAMALTIALIEAIGGAFLVLGLVTRLDALLLSAVMIGAYTLGHPEAFKSFEAFTTAAPFLFLYASLIILAFGPGSLSLDALIRRPGACGSSSKKA